MPAFTVSDAIEIVALTAADPNLSPAFAAALAPFAARRPTDAQMERLSTALDAYNRADLAYDDGSSEAAKVCIRAQNVLLDTCVECGMPTDGDEFAFAARMVTRWLVEA